MIFTETERSYLAGQPMGRLATVNARGEPQVRPPGFRVNPDDTIDLGGPWVRRTQRARNIASHPQVAFVVDDLSTDPEAVKPGWGRGVEVRGDAEVVTIDDPPGDGALAGRDVIRVHPRRIHSWHIDPDDPDGSARNV